MASLIVASALTAFFTLSLAVPMQLELRPTVRRWGEGGPCAREDSVCMNNMAVQYTNAVRGRAGKAPIESGSKYMYENAMKHSRNMMNGAPFEHQPIREGLTVGSGSKCEALLTGENIAYDFVPFSGASNPAKICVDAWEKSPGHYKNMIGDHANNVVGITIGKDNRIWCTQVFSQKKAGGAGMCAKPDNGVVVKPPVSPRPSPGNSPTPTSSPSPSPAPKKSPPPTPECTACKAGTDCNPRSSDYRCVGGRCVRSMKPEAIAMCYPRGLPMGTGNRPQCHYCDDSAQCKGVCINHQCLKEANYMYLLECEKPNAGEKHQTAAFFVPNDSYYWSTSWSSSS